ncbi:Uncharacterised protein [Mycobacteroides abscessus subsp. abscessus]|nr:Uncharacterised protein [Mycobacteroides abscessus subsp. abscessus]
MGATPSGAVVAAAARVGAEVAVTAVGVAVVWVVSSAGAASAGPIAVLRARTASAPAAPKRRPRGQEAAVRMLMGCIAMRLSAVGEPHHHPR